MVCITQMTESATSWSPCLFCASAIHNHQWSRQHSLRLLADTKESEKCSHPAFYFFTKARKTKPHNYLPIPTILFPFPPIKEERNTSLWKALFSTGLKEHNFSARRNKEHYLLAFYDFPLANKCIGFDNLKRNFKNYFHLPA